MVKTPDGRHSKSRKDPVTIDLEASRISPEEVTPAEAPAADSPEELSSASHEPAESALVAEASEAAVESGLSDSPADEGGERKPASFETSDEDNSNLRTTDQVSEVIADDVARDSAAAEGATAEESAKADESSAASKADERVAGASPAEDVKTYGRTPSDFGRRASGAAATPPPPPPRPERRGGLSAIAAGLIGAIIALIGAGALQYGVLLPSPRSSGGDAAAVDGLRADLDALKAEIAGLKVADNGEAVQQTVADLQSKVATLATDLGTVREAVEAGGAGENAGLAALDAKLAEVQAQLARLTESGTAGTPVDLGPVNKKIAALEAGIKSAAAAAAASDARFATLEKTVASLAGKVDAQGNQPKIALSIAASALKAAIDRGQPFAAELETLAAISPNLPQLAALRAHAEAGVAAREDLAKEMDGAADAMIAAGNPVDPNAGLMDKLWQSAASLVTVRPVGAVAGEGVPETVARMEAAVDAGDLAKALAEYDTLPEAAKAAGAAFAAKIKARLDVETLVDQAIAEAMKTV